MTCGSRSVETGALPRPGKCLTQADHLPVGEPAREGETECGPREVPRPERPALQVDHGREVAVDALSAQRPSGRAPGVSRRRLRPVRGRSRGRRQGRERPDLPTFLVDEDEHVLRTRLREVPALHQDARGSAGRLRNRRDDDERGLVARGEPGERIGVRRRRRGRREPERRDGRLCERCEEHGLRLVPWTSRSHRSSARSRQPSVSSSTSGYCRTRSRTTSPTISTWGSSRAWPSSASSEWSSRRSTAAPASTSSPRRSSARRSSAARRRFARSSPSTSG